MNVDFGESSDDKDSMLCGCLLLVVFLLKQFVIVMRMMMMRVDIYAFETLIMFCHFVDQYHNTTKPLDAASRTIV